jgi:hypothetical protein
VKARCSIWQPHVLSHVRTIAKVCSGVGACRRRLRVDAGADGRDAVQDDRTSRQAEARRPSASRSRLHGMAAALPQRQQQSTASTPSPYPEHPVAVACRHEEPRSVHVVSQRKAEMHPPQRRAALRSLPAERTRSTVRVPSTGHLSHSPQAKTPTAVRGDSRRNSSRRLRRRNAPIPPT